MSQEDSGKNREETLSTVVSTTKNTWKINFFVRNEQTKKDDNGDGKKKKKIKKLKK